jgi:hypothetical protein
MDVTCLTSRGNFSGKYEIESNMAEKHGSEIFFRQDNRIFCWSIEVMEYCNANLCSNTPVLQYSILFNPENSVILKYFSELVI